MSMFSLNVCKNEKKKKTTRSMKKKRTTSNSGGILCLNNSGGERYEREGLRVKREETPFNRCSSRLPADSQPPASCQPRTVPPADLDHAIAADDSVPARERDGIRARFEADLFEAEPGLMMRKPDGVEV